MLTTSMKRFLVFLVVVLVLSSCTASYECTDPQDTSCIRILFIGNSLTFVNDLPNTFAALARSGKQKVQVGMYAQPGWTLADHVKSADTTKALNSQTWTYVVLQEHSLFPSVQELRNAYMYPALRTLVPQTRNTGAVPLLFLTWARHGGYPEYGMYDYEGMQFEVNNGSYSIARELNMPVVPIGSAWRQAAAKRPELTLWQEDGNHPTEQGTYLSACVLYEAIFHESPVGLKYIGNLSKELATTLQTVASEIKY